MPRSIPLYLFLLLAVTGCLPSSCQREESRALLPSDSLSLHRAAAVPVDTMRLAWHAESTAEHPLAFPRTVAFGPDGRIYVADVERNSLFVFDGSGRFLGEQGTRSFEIPYLAGFRGDTLVVFNPPALRLDLVLEGTVVRSIPVAVEPARGALVYAAATDDAFYFKQAGDAIGGFIARLDEAGQPVQRYALDAPYWRYAGLLRTWGDSLLSLSGYRPVADVVVPGAATLDTLAFTGFDSPMLARSRSFMLGEVGEAPLLTPAAAAAGDLLFVLNLRPGWLRVDAFDHAGLLQRRLSQASPTYRQNFFPQDLAVRERPGGGYEMAVVFKEPVPRLELYRF